MASGIGADHRLPSRAADEAGYPGAPPGAVPGFTPDDATAFWFLDFHWPRGLTPLGMVWLEDGYTHGTHRAAARLPLPAGHGVAARVVGTHVYAASVALAHPAEIEARRRRLQRRLPAFVDAFPGLWERRLDELETGWRALLAEAPAALTRPGLARYLRRARRYHLRAYEIHFEVMYPLAAVATRFYDLCAGLDLDPALSSRVLQGYDNRALQTDRALWALAGSARRLGLAALFAAHDIADLPRALAADPAAAGWLRELDAMLEEFGWRTEGSCDVALPSWVEDPSIPLATVKRLLRQEFPHDMAAAAEAAAADRVVAVDAARARLTRAEQARFDAGLAACTRANFSWWQDEHNAFAVRGASGFGARLLFELLRAYAG